MNTAYSLFIDSPVGDGLILASLLVIAGLLFGPRLRDQVQHICRVRERVLIIGTSPMARRVVDEINQSPDRRAMVVGVVDRVADLGRLIEQTRPHRIVVALAERRGRLPLCGLIESRARGIRVEDVIETHERLTGKLALELLSPSSVIFSKNFQAPARRLDAARALSLLVSAAGLILLAPLMGAIALLIKLDSRGPVFFVQERVGRFGRPFALIKFRTMDPLEGPRSEWERDNSYRITRFGHWLRRFRLDELPQLLNVLRGDMNLVGPRPHPTTNLELLTLTVRNLSEVSGDAIPYYSLRCSVRPGITGWAQVRYRYANSLDQEVEKIRYDFYYLKHRSFWLDLMILAETVRIVVVGGRSTTDLDEDSEEAITARLAAVRRADAPVRRTDAPVRRTEAPVARGDALVLSEAASALDAAAPVLPGPAVPLNDDVPVPEIVPPQRSVA